MKKYVILTGIERSGSSYLVDILNNHINVIFLNEPPLEYLPSKPERIMDYLTGYRKRILSGFPVQGVFKAETSELAWDTLGSSYGGVESRPYVAQYADKDFVFGFKSLTPTLRLIYELRRFYHDISFIAILRHPVDTIFSQLRNGGGLLPVIPNATEGIKKITKTISRISNPVARAAYVWKFNTSIIIDNLDIFKIAKYSAICENPEKQAEFLLRGTNPKQKIRDIAQSEPIRHKDEFSVDGRALIAKICRTNAVKLGLWD